MRQSRLPLLILLLALPCPLLAEQVAATGPGAVTPPPALDQLQQELVRVQQERDQLASRLEGNLAERENAQMQRLRQENQKLKLQVREAQARQPQNLLSERQTWYLLGAATALLGAVAGALMRGYRRRRQWIN